MDERAIKDEANFRCARGQCPSSDALACWDCLFPLYVAEYASQAATPGTCTWPESSPPIPPPRTEFAGAAGQMPCTGHMVFAIDGSRDSTGRAISRCLEGCVCGGHVDPRHRDSLRCAKWRFQRSPTDPPHIPPDQVGRHRRRQGLSARLQRGACRRCPPLAEERRPHRSR